MLRLMGLVVSIGMADSFNPTTIAPALYLATGRPRAPAGSPNSRWGCSRLLGRGRAVALGPGQLLLSLVPHPRPYARHIVEIVVGVASGRGAPVLWRHRRRLSDRDPPTVEPATTDRAALLGATITAVELPTAFPYFAAIAAIVGSGLEPGRQMILLLIFNVCFILPLLVIIATLWFGGPRAELVLSTVRNFLQRRWPVVLSGLLMLAGVFIIALGITGLGMRQRNDFGELSRRFRTLFRFGGHP